jgi:RNA polymerase sigma factor (TIGR02999 family)
VNAGGEITLLLAAVRRGEPGALDRILPLVYDELRTLARRQLARGRPGPTLATTALVHEAYLKLVDQRQADWRDRSHFLAVAATAMRHIVVDRARHRAADKRGGGAPHVDLGDTAGAVDGPGDEILAVDEALDWLDGLDHRLGQLVELRFFGGLSVEETAEVQGTSARTVKRDWRKARALLHSFLAGEQTLG